MDTMTAEHTSPHTARGARRRSWVDPRLVVGLILVAASIAGMTFLMHLTDQRVPFYTAAHTLTPGDLVTADALGSEPMRLGDERARYFTTADAFPEGARVTRVIAAGELVPRSALSAGASDEVSSVVIPVSGALPRAIEPGTQVEVWAARQIEHLNFEPPTVITPATVAVVTPPSAVAVGAGITVEVRVPRELVANVLESLAHKDSISLVPVGGPVADSVPGAP